MSKNVVLEISAARKVNRAVTLTTTTTHDSDNVMARCQMWKRHVEKAAAAELWQQCQMDGLHNLNFVQGLNLNCSKLKLEFKDL